MQICIKIFGIMSLQEDALTLNPAFPWFLLIIRSRAPCNFKRYVRMALNLIVLCMQSETTFQKYFLINIKK